MYKKALESEGCQAVHLTSIEEDFECDTYLEGFDQVRCLKIPFFPFHQLYMPYVMACHGLRA